MAAARAPRARRCGPALRVRLHAARELGARRGRGRRPRRPHHACRAGVPQPRPATGLPAHAAHAGGLRAAPARARLRRGHRGDRHGGRGAAAAGRRRGPATPSSSRPSSARSGCASSRRSSASGRPSRTRARAGCSAPGRRRGASRSRASTASRPPPATARVEDDWLYIACVATFPERRRLGLARAVSERLFAWGAGGGARRAILQAETKNAAAQGALRAARLPPPATSIATSSRALTNTPFWASQGPDECCRCRSQTPPGSAAGTPGGLW